MLNAASTISQHALLCALASIDIGGTIFELFLSSRLRFPSFQYALVTYDESSTQENSRFIYVVVLVAIETTVSFRLSRNTPDIKEACYE